MKTPFLKAFKMFPFALTMVLAMSLGSCAKEDVTADAGNASDVQADVLTAYGYCATCELAPGTSGSLSTVLMVNDDFLNVMRHCYEETTAEVCSSGIGTLQATTMDTHFNIYLGGAQWGGNTVSNHCSFLYQLGNAAHGNRPSGQWLLEEVRDIVYLGTNNFRVYLTWRKYMCGVYGDPELPRF